METVALTAWEFDSRFRVLQRWILVQPLVTPAGEQVYRVPANATLVQPPEPPAGRKSLVFLEAGRWITLPDHRGEQWFDHKDRPVMVERLGDPEVWGWNREPVMRSRSGACVAGSCGL